MQRGFVIRVLLQQKIPGRNLLLVFSTVKGAISLSSMDCVTSISVQSKNCSAEETPRDIINPDLSILNVQFGLRILEAISAIEDFSATILMLIFNFITNIGNPDSLFMILT